MKEKVKKLAAKLHPLRVNNVLTEFLKDESIGGKLILAFAILSLIVVNSSLIDEYARFWRTYVSLGVGGWSLSMDLRHWVNEGLMAFFFLTVGLEIKRELVHGELRDFKKALLPIGAAVGGMVVPAVVYFALNGVSSEGVRGWGIPIATDIAFAVAVLALLGNRIPTVLKVFLLTLAIADDIGAIFVIALFYAEIIHYGYLLTSILIVVALFLLRKKLINQLTLVIFAGIILWVTTHLSGIHASIVGAAMGLLAPVTIGQRGLSVAERVEKFLLPFTTFFVLPVFAFANAGFVLSGEALTGNPTVVWGIILGLIFGKMVGISLTSFLLVKFKAAELPKGLGWYHIAGVGLIAGIGFTVSIFITELAFAGNEALINSAKAGILIASIASAVLGSLVLLMAGKWSDS
jgi:NhaA family Na+:H+ antiporter